MDRFQYGTASFISAADLSAKNGYAVKLNGSLTNGQAQVALAGANEKAIGIIYDGGRQSGDQVGVALDGVICLAVLGGTVASGAFLKADSAGKLVTAGGTGDDNVIGQAIGAGSAGESIKVLITKFIL